MARVSVRKENAVRQVTPDEVLRLMKLDLPQLPVEMPEPFHFTAQSLYLQWLRHTLDAIESHELNVDDALVDEWRYRRASVFRWPLRWNPRIVRRAHVTLNNS